MQRRGVSWRMGWLGIAALGVVACGRPREPSRQETPSQQAPAAEESLSEGVLPPPSAPEAAREEKKSDLLEREAPADQGAGRGLGSAAPGESRGQQKKPAPAPASKSRSRDDDGVGTVGDRNAMPADLERAEAELHANFGRLGDALRLSSPDCPSARQFGARVCDLAEHICRLAEQGNEPEELALCVDGRNRCAEARRRLGERCAE